MKKRVIPRHYQRVVLASIVILSLQGCASLPDARREMEKTRTQEVKFESARGPVPEGRAGDILEKLQGGGVRSKLLEKHLAYEQAVNADNALVVGNKLTLLKNGPATYEAMFAAIREAKDSINLETYIFDDDEIGRRFSDLLLQRQSEGVQVNIIHDSIGTLFTPSAFFDRLRTGGVQVLEFNPVNPLAHKKRAWRLNNRDHRRQLIVDGRVAFTGGVNISGTYASAPKGRRIRKWLRLPAKPTIGWRDTHIKIEGPVVAEFQRMYLDTWARQNGEPLAARNYFPDLTSAGDEVVRAIGSTPDHPQSQIYLTLMSAITHSESAVHLTVAYFAPDPQLLKALIDAAKRGVDVRLVLPSYSDSSAIFHLGRSYYADLLRGGVHIYELRGAVMHAKTACIDGVWSTVGSSNLDWRSFLHNDELNAVILGHNFAEQMDAMFAEDLTESAEIKLEEWQHRSLMMRLKERLARLAAYWL